jgi:integrase
LGLDESWDRYVASPSRPDSGPNTLAGYESHFDQFKKWLEGKYPGVKTLKDVSPTIAAAYAAHLTSRKLTGNRFNKHIRFLRTFFRVLKTSARIAQNPWEDIQRKRQVAVSRRDLTIEELKKVCLSAEGEMRILFALGLYTGLRLGDCATLLWGEVDLVRGIIRRIPNETARRNPTPVLVPIHAVLRSLLEETPKERRTGLVLPGMAKQYASHPVELAHAIKKRFTDNGIATTSGIPSTRTRAAVTVGFHSLRHTFVSLCREANAPLAVVAAIVGHSNPAMTRHYTHVSEEAAALAVAALPQISGKALPAPKARPTDDELLASLAEMTEENWQTTRDRLVAALSAK